MGTGPAVLVCFRRGIASIVKARWVWAVRPEYCKGAEARMGWFVIVGTLPSGPRVTFQGAVETCLCDLRVMAAGLVVFGVVRAVAGRSRASVLRQADQRAGLSPTSSAAVLPGHWLWSPGCPAPAAR